MSKAKDTSVTKPAPESVSKVHKGSKQTNKYKSLFDMTFSYIFLFLKGSPNQQKSDANDRHGTDMCADEEDVEYEEVVLEKQLQTIKWDLQFHQEELDDLLNGASTKADGVTIQSECTTLEDKVMYLNSKVIELKTPHKDITKMRQAVLLRNATFRTHGKSHNTNDRARNDITASTGHPDISRNTTYNNSSADVLSKATCSGKSPAVIHVGQGSRDSQANKAIYDQPVSISIANPNEIVTCGKKHTHHPGKDTTLEVSSSPGSYSESYTSCSSVSSFYTDEISGQARNTVAGTGATKEMPSRKTAHIIRVAEKGRMAEMIDEDEKRTRESMHKSQESSESSSSHTEGTEGFPTGVSETWATKKNNNSGRDTHEFDGKPGKAQSEPKYIVADEKYKESSSVSSSNDRNMPASSGITAAGEFISIEQISSSRKMNPSSTSESTSSGDEEDNSAREKTSTPSARLIVVGEHNKQREPEPETEQQTSKNVVLKLDRNAPCEDDNSASERVFSPATRLSGISEHNEQETQASRSVVGTMDPGTTSDSASSDNEGDGHTKTNILECRPRVVRGAKRSPEQAVTVGKDKMCPQIVNMAAHDSVSNISVSYSSDSSDHPVQEHLSEIHIDVNGNTELTQQADACWKEIMVFREIDKQRNYEQESANIVSAIYENVISVSDKDNKKPFRQDEPTNKTSFIENDNVSTAMEYVSEHDNMQNRENVNTILTDKEEQINENETGEHILELDTAKKCIVQNELEIIGKEKIGKPTIYKKRPMPQNQGHRILVTTALKSESESEMDSVQEHLKVVKSVLNDESSDAPLTNVQKQSQITCENKVSAISHKPKHKEADIRLFNTLEDSMMRMQTERDQQYEDSISRRKKLQAEIKAITKQLESLAKSRAEQDGQDQQYIDKPNTSLARIRQQQVHASACCRELKESKRRQQNAHVRNITKRCRCLPCEDSTAGSTSKPTQRLPNKNNKAMEKQTTKGDLTALMTLVQQAIAKPQHAGESNRCASTMNTRVKPKHRAMAILNDHDRLCCPSADSKDRATPIHSESKCTKCQRTETKTATNQAMGKQLSKNKELHTSHAKESVNQLTHLRKPPQQSISAQETSEQQWKLMFFQMLTDATRGSLADFRVRREQLEELQELLLRHFDLSNRKATLLEKMIEENVFGIRISSKYLPPSGQFLEERITGFPEGSQSLIQLLTLDRFLYICILFKYVGEEILRVLMLAHQEVPGYESTFGNGDLQTPTQFHLCIWDEPATEIALTMYTLKLRVEVDRLLYSLYDLYQNNPVSIKYFPNKSHVHQPKSGIADSTMKTPLASHNESCYPTTTCTSHTRQADGMDTRESIPSTNLSDGYRRPDTRSNTLRHIVATTPASPIPMSSRPRTEAQLRSSRPRMESKSTQPMSNAESRSDKRRSYSASSPITSRANTTNTRKSPASTGKPMSLNYGTAESRHASESRHSPYSRPRPNPKPTELFNPNQSRGPAIQPRNEPRVKRADRTENITVDKSALRDDSSAHVVCCPCVDSGYRPPSRQRASITTGSKITESRYTGTGLTESINRRCVESCNAEFRTADSRPFKPKLAECMPVSCNKPTQYKSDESNANEPRATNYKPDESTFISETLTILAASPLSELKPTNFRTLPLPTSLSKNMSISSPLSMPGYRPITIPVSIPQPMTPAVSPRHRVDITKKFTTIQVVEGDNGYMNIVHTTPLPFKLERS